MFDRLTKLALGLAVPLALMTAGPALAEIRDQTVKFASANNKGHPQVTGMEKFAELVKEKSGGKIEVKLFPGGTLGGDVQTVSALQGGVIEMTVLNPAFWRATSRSSARSTSLPVRQRRGGGQGDGWSLRHQLDGTPARHRARRPRLLGARFPQPDQQPASGDQARRHKGPEDPPIQSPIPVGLFNALGANAVPLPYTELYTALETGTVDGQENPSANIINAKFYEVQKYMTLTRHQYNPQIVLVSKKFWDGLNDEEKTVLQQAAVEARDFQRKVSREQDAAALEEIRKTGMEVSELSPEETQKLRDAVKPMIEKFSADIGQETVEALFKEIGTARGQ